MPATRRGNGRSAAGGGRTAAGEPSPARWTLGPVQAAVDARLAAWARTGATEKVWRREPGFWPHTASSEIARGLGWLLAPEHSASRLDDLVAFAERVVRDGVEHVVLLGMGGSSLAPEVIASVAPRAPGWPELTVLDSTHPEAVRACLARAPVDRSLYVVSSKSGTTLETTAFFHLLWERANAAGAPGRRFVAITDAGTPLEQLAAAKKFRACFLAPPDVVGRYSALTVFGLLPAALVGADLRGVLRSARAMVARCMEKSEPDRNPGLRLGAALGELGRAGRDKLVFVTSETLRPFPAWVEQLVAESLGKRGRGIVPVAAVPPGAAVPSGTDVALVHLGLEGEDEPETRRALEQQEAAGTPVLRFALPSRLDLGREFFRWEFAVATSAAVTEVNPFDQPDVEHAKQLAREAMDPSRRAVSFGSAYGIGVGADRSLREALGRWLASGRPGDYAAVLAFLAPSPATEAALGRLAARLQTRLQTVVTVGYGPRFLHSTGQLHKGGPSTGLFLQLVDEPKDDLPVPELGLSFGAILRAQARGDRAALEEKGRRLLVVNVGATAPEGVDALERLVGEERAPA